MTTPAAPKSFPIIEELDQSFSGSENQVQVRFRVMNVANGAEAMLAIRNPNYFRPGVNKPDLKYTYWPWVYKTNDALSTAGGLATNLPQWFNKDYTNVRANSLYLTDVRVEEIESPYDTFPIQKKSLYDVDYQLAQYLVTAVYSPRAICPVVEFDMQSTTQKITHSLVTRKIYAGADSSEIASSDSPPPANSGYNMNNAMNVDMTDTNAGMKVNGTNKIVPAMRINVRWNPPPGPFLLNKSHLYYSILNDSIGTINSVPFLGLDVGSVLFTGANARVIDSVNNFYEFNYTFLCLPNQSGWRGVDKVSIASPGIKLYGHDHVWMTRISKTEDRDFEVEDPNNPGQYITATIPTKVSDSLGLWVERIYEWENHNRFFYYPYSSNATMGFDWTTLPDYIATNPVAVVNESLNPKLRQTSYVNPANYSPIQNCPLVWPAPTSVSTAPDNPEA